MTNVHPWVYGYNTRLKHQKLIMGYYLQVSTSAFGYNRGPHLRKTLLLPSAVNWCIARTTTSLAVSIQRCPV